MTREDWELTSWIATTLGFVLAVLGLLAVIFQLQSQNRQSKFGFLNQLYAQLDTHEARLAREYIYSAPLDQLRFDVLHSPDFKNERKLVEETLATLERVAYPIAFNQVPSEDAFNLYGGVLLSVAFRLWPYIEDQRHMRREKGLRKRLSYRRYLEVVIRLWAPKYAKEAGLEKPGCKLSTQDMLNSLFSANVAA